ncbi:TPA_asm: type 1 fimbrial protein [Salmonella enterica subsp. enterica serovar Muenchen]|nr:type 1 fimbrial protein [Salmonella enterica]ECT9500546.1 type 1 fimbrial protein [Salmonella enterica subsp. enterica serovar Infantis]EEJ2343799.1 type 1 fimbrial protein [Salmonella enterica subsp. enterica serovar Oslo]MBA6283812.1 type 1 fimbrial protein [Salmonella enterica subsp. enterica serovar Irumu]MKV95185.1 type 1 fimbrial protein [Salmonella enterica subsp. enterica serovar Fresno]HAE7669445.1 type 1 fimbrial protein [Salmonella enterica subsp. enterica serovar Muenchen]
MKNRFYRAAGLVTAMLLPGLTILPARAAKVADGTVSFTGEMLGATTCTLENHSLTADFGTINVDRKGEIPANPLTSGKTVAFRFTGCATNIQKVNMTVDFDSVFGDDSLIENAEGSAGNVAGVLVCPANALMQGEACTAGARIRAGSVVHGVVNSNREVSFPLEVSLVSFDGFNPSSPYMPDAGSINMTVRFTFEEE